MYLVEHFISVQGEGKFSGYPSLFFRFGGCNFSCSGFGVKFEIDGDSYFGCDSYYGVNQKFKKNWIEIKSINELLEIVQKSYDKLNYKPHIVITGGEPTLFFNQKIMQNFIVDMLNSGYFITVETNGTVPFEYKSFKNVTFALAIKLSNSNEYKRVNRDVINQIIENSKNSFFKFTIDKNYIEEFGNSEIEEITKDYDIPIYCMPLGANSLELQKNCVSLIDFCIKYNYIYSDRIHIRVYDNKRGV